MQILRNAYILAAALSLSPALANPRQPQRREAISSSCIPEYTYGSIQDPSTYLPTTPKTASVSSGDLCCDLCHRSVYDCLYSRFDDETGVCEMTVNQDTERLAVAESPAERRVCKAGVLREGIIAQKKPDRNHYWIGPCWTPLDVSGHWQLPGPPPYPIEVANEEDAAELAEGVEVEIISP